MNSSVTTSFQHLWIFNFNFTKTFLQSSGSGLEARLCSLFLIFELLFFSLKKLFALVCISAFVEALRNQRSIYVTLVNVMFTHIAKIHLNDDSDFILIPAKI